MTDTDRPAPPAAPVAAGQSTTGGSQLIARVAPLGRRLRSEAGSAGLLLIATAIALVWANSPVGESYDSFWHTEFAVRFGGTELSLDLQHWVNDGLMVFFFFVVGLEIKRELVMGELTDRRRAAVPALAAVAGLVVPALVYVGFNLGDEAAGAWGVVISTDTAFLLGVLALVGPACPAQLRIFLLTLAIADDVGALTVIALFYTDDLALGPLAVAVLGLALMVGLRYLNVWRGPAYLVIGLAIWVAMYESGVHPTIAGVVIALFAPAYPARRDEVADAARRLRAYQQSPNAEFARAARLSIDRSVSATERLQALWQPWTSLVIVPVFALANAGVALDGDTLAAASSSSVTMGVIAGLVVGKLVGILLGTWAAVRSGLGDLAPGVHGLHVAGGAALSGIGFTISLFIVDLAFSDERVADQARVGVLVATVVAALLGWALFRAADRRYRESSGRPVLLDPPVDPDRDHIRGPVDAPLTLVEYGDFECPFCGRATGSVDELRRRFGDRLRYVFRHTPLVDVHPNARLAAEAAEAAAAQGRFWEMHDQLFRHQDQLRPRDLVDHAAAVGLDLARFTRDLGESRFARRVQDDLTSAEVSGVTGTPTFFIGGRRHTGPFDAATLAAELLAAAGDDHGLLEPATGAEAPMAPPPMLGVRRDPARRGPQVPGVELPADLPETPDTQGAFPRLSDTQLTLLEQCGGRRRPVRRGEALFREGDEGYDFFVVLAGTVAVVENHGRADQRLVSVHGPGRFLGELDIFTPGVVSLTAVLLTDGEVLWLQEDQLAAAKAADSSFSDLVLRAFLVRRSILLELAADVRILGYPGTPETERLRTGAAERGLDAVVVDVGAAGGAALLDGLGVAAEDLPVVVTRDGTLARSPDGPEWEDLLRLAERGGVVTGD